MKTALQILIEGRALISCPDRWTQEALARDIEGEPVHSDDVDAVCFCSRGAVDQVCRSELLEGSNEDAVLDFLRVQMDGSIEDFNDSRPHAEVLAAWDRAIAAQPAVSA